jgi:GNAT superfamily N-acetyltransferase
MSVQIVLTTSSNTVGARSMRPAPSAHQERSSERIDTVYVQEGARLAERHGDFSAPAWFAEREGEHSVAYQRAECEHHLAAGGIALGAFANGQLVGIGIVRPNIRPGVAQFAFLYVSSADRGQGVGRHLSEELERLARERGGHDDGRLGDTVPQYRPLLPSPRL